MYLFLLEHYHHAPVAAEAAPDARWQKALFTKDFYLHMNWITLTNEQQLQQLKANSNVKPQVIFKHSTRCSISSVAKNRLERSSQPDEIDFYFLDLIKFRAMSNKIAEDFKVYHESPQILLIKNGKCIYDESHSGIDMEEIVQQAMVA